MAEISVPAWPIPIHHTKLMMAKPQPTGMSRPQMPTPFRNSQVTAVSSMMQMPPASRKAEEPAHGRVRGEHDPRNTSRDRLEGVTGRNDPELAGHRVQHRIVYR